MQSIAVAAYSLATSPALRLELETRYPTAAVSWNTTSQVMDAAALLKFLKGHTHAILGRETLNEALIQQLPELKVVSKYGVGLDSLDFDAMARAGIQLGWKPGVNRRAVAELALTFMMTAVRGIHLATSGVKQGNWVRPSGRQLTGKTVGLIGCGNVGQELSLLLSPFQVRILAHDIRASEPEYQAYFVSHGIESVDLDTLLTTSDVVSLHVPKNNSTLNLMDARALRRMKPGSILVNTARGGLVDEAATLDALEDHHLTAAAFDVFVDEPSHHQALIAHPAFIGTPHIGGASLEAVHAMGRAAIDGLSTPVDPLTLKRYL